MAGTREAPSMIAITRVKSGQEQAFEAFVRESIVPAVEKVRPQLMGQWQTWKPANDPTGESDGPAYVFAFYGDAPINDWDLEPIFAQAHGEDEGARVMQRFMDLLDGDQDVFQLTGDVST